jgi:hypothetical protein
VTETSTPRTDAPGAGRPVEVTPGVATGTSRDAPPVEARVERPPNEIHAAVEALGEALLELASTRTPELAATLAKLLAAVATEASRSPRLARALSDAAVSSVPAVGSAATSEKRQHRRTPGPFDPFAVFAEVGEEGLRERLASLTSDQLRDIIAEHRMDQDRLAMKWKDSTRLAERIIERIKTRSVKGDVFRTSS